MGLWGCSLSSHTLLAPATTQRPRPHRGLQSRAEGHGNTAHTGSWPWASPAPVPEVSPQLTPAMPCGADPPSAEPKKPSHERWLCLLSSALSFGVVYTSRGNRRQKDGYTGAEGHGIGLGSFVTVYRVCNLLSKSLKKINTHTPEFLIEPYGFQVVLLYNAIMTRLRLVLIPAAVETDSSALRYQRQLIAATLEHQVPPCSPGSHPHGCGQANCVLSFPGDSELKALK